MYKISSKDRTNGSSSNMLINLDGRIGELKGEYKCVMVSLPVYWYNINTNNNKIPVSVGGNDATAELKVGNYTADNLPDAISASLNTVGGGAVFNTVLDEVNKKLTISCDAAFTLKFSKSGVCNEILGFTSTDIASTANVSNSVTGNYPINLNPIKSVSINIEGGGTSVVQSNGFSCTFMCPIVRPLAWELNVYEYENPPRVYFNDAIRQMRVRVIDSDTGNELDLNGGEWFFILQR